MTRFAVVRRPARAGRSGRSLLPLAAACAALLATAACGGASAGGSAGSSKASATSSVAAGGGSGVVHSAKTPLGSVLETSNGQVVYLLTSDKKAGSSCTGGCLQVWPPVEAGPADPTATGVAGRLGVLSRPDGTRQLTVGGHPAYTYAADTAAGQTSGQGIRSYGGTWWAIDAAGSAVTGSAGVQRGGYGY